MSPIRIFVIFLFLAVTYGVSAQSNIADSLENVASTLPDSTRAKKYMEWTLGLPAPQNLNMARYGLSWASDQNNKKLAADLLDHMGKINFMMGEFPLALDCHQKALIIYTELDDKVMMGHQHIMFGRLFSKTKYLTIGEAEYRNALSIFKSINDSNGIATSYNYLGNIYHDYKHELDSALGFYFQSLNYSRGIGDSNGVAWTLGFIGGVYAEQGDFQNSREMLYRELEIRKQIRDSLGEAININNIGESYKMEGRILEAEKYFLTALEMAIKLDYKDFESHIYTMLAEISRDKKDYANAYKYMELRSAVRDSLISEKKNYQITELREKFESEKKEQTIASLQRDKELDHQKRINLRNYFLTAILVLLLGGVIGWLYYNQQQQRRLARERLEREQERMRSIIEAEEKERIRIARELHDGVGQLLAAAKMNLAMSAGQNEGAVQLVDDAIKEVRNVSHSMMPDVLMKYGLAKAIQDLCDKLSIPGTPSIHLQISGFDERWESSSESILYRVVQELLTNILKHAEASQINIDLNKFEDEISLIVEDDGKGFDPSGLSQDTGIGLQNMQTRIAFLGGHLLLDSTVGHGTTVIITIPINSKQHSV